MLNIVKDIRKGALPKSEIPGFILYLIGETFWFWMFVLVIGSIVVFGL